jgi:hypothetical protein
VEHKGDGKMNEELKESLRYYQKKKCEVHITLKNKRFYNGIITELFENTFIFHDHKLGELSITFNEVFVVERFQKPEERRPPKYDRNS